MADVAFRERKGEGTNDNCMVGVAFSHSKGKAEGKKEKRFNGWRCIPAFEREREREREAAKLKTPP